MLATTPWTIPKYMDRSEWCRGGDLSFIIQFDYLALAFYNRARDGGHSFERMFDCPTLRILVVVVKLP